MNGNYRIDAARPADFPELLQLLESLFLLEQDFAPTPEKQREGLAQLLAAAERACVLVARDGAGKAVGMVSGQMVISTAEGAFSLWVEDVVIAAEHRGQGLGRALLRDLLTWAKARGATRAQLLVDLDNHPAQEFYARLGWRQTRLGACRLPL